MKSPLWTDNVSENHHAYLVVGPREPVLSELTVFLEEKWGIASRGNPDFSINKYDTFGIEDSRTLKHSQERKSFSDEKKIFVLSLNFITNEAENALLKTFEEPSRNTFSFLIVENEERLRPTLRSRFFVIRRQSGETGEPNNDIDAYLSMTLAERLAHVKKIVDNIADDKADKSTALDLIDGLISALSRKLKHDPSDKQLIVTLAELNKCRDYMTDRSPSLKMILEYISLIV